MEAAAPVLRPGEESQQLGDDATFVFRFKKALRQEPLAASVLDSLRPLAEAHGLDMEELAFVIETRVPTMRATLEREGIASFRMDCAIAIYLYTIDDLTDIIEENVRQRREAAESAELLVDDGATHFVRERRAHQSRELLKRFRDQAEAVKGAELERALRELKAGGDPEAVVNTLARSITNKLIHQPTVAIREASADGRADLIEYLKTLYRLD